MLIGIAPDTALGRIVAIRAEDRKEYLENFTPEQHRIRNKWKTRHAEFIKNHTSKEQMDAQLDTMKMVACIVAIWIICNEIISILENIKDMGVAIPAFLLPIVEHVKSQVEDKANIDKDSEGE